MKKRVGMNKKLIAIISVIIILCGAAAGLWYNRQHSAEQPKTPSTNVSDAAKFKSEYPRVAANNRFVYASDKEVLSIFDSGSGVVFLGFPQCPWYMCGGGFGALWPHPALARASSRHEMTNSARGAECGHGQRTGAEKVTMVQQETGVEDAASS